jgi:hypothetical protein
LYFTAKFQITSTKLQINPKFEISMTETMQKLKFLVIWKEQVVLVVGAASSRDHLISRLEAAPTWFFFW